MSAITRITVRRFKSLRDMELDLGNLTVLIGANGSGKSNLISFFTMLGFMQSGDLQEFIGLNGGASAMLHFGPKVSTSIDAELSFRTESGTTEYAFRLVHAAGDTFIFSNETMLFSREDMDRNTARRHELGAGHRESLLREWVRLPQEQQTTARVMQGIMSGWHVFQFHDTSDASAIKQFRYLNDNSYLRRDGGNLAPLLLRMRQERPDHYERIRKTIQLCAPFFRDFVLEPQDQESAPRVMLNWKERGADMLFGPHHLSDGTLRFMCLTTLLLQPVLPRLIVIDEPELGLHPMALAILADLLKQAAAQTQILVATQSATLLDHFSPEEVVVAERLPDSSTMRRLTSQELEAWLDDYSLGDLWRKNVLGGRP